MYLSSRYIDTEYQLIASADSLRMAERTKAANKGHNLRSLKCDTLKIVRDQAVYASQNLEEK